MKRKSCVLLVALCIIFSNSTIAMGDAAEEFGEAYEETEVITGEMFMEISGAFKGGGVQESKLLEKADRLIENSRTLKQAAEQLNQTDSAGEAAQMENYMMRVREILEKGGREEHLLTMLLARYYLHYNNCVMDYPGYLKIMVKDHVEEVRNALEENRIQDVVHLAEHLHLHCDQMYYSAMIFGKIIWQKFSTETKIISDQIFEAAMNNDIEGVKKGLVEIEKPVQMLQQLVN